VKASFTIARRDARRQSRVRVDSALAKAMVPIGKVGQARVACLMKHLGQSGIAPIDAGAL